MQKLDKEIEEFDNAAASLQRTRNALRKIWELHDETLGEVFRWCLVQNRCGRDAYSFRLVCHRWYTAASRAPGLWSRWGDGLNGWERNALCYRSGPIDLLLEQQGQWMGSQSGWGASGGWGAPDEYLDSRDERLASHVHDRLKGCAARGVIRRVNLDCRTSLLEEILSSLLAGAPLFTGLMELSVVNTGQSPSDVSKFFTSPLPKLQRLKLSQCKVSWDGMVNHTGSLVALTFTNLAEDHTLTVSQLLPVLSANPLLEHLELELSGPVGAVETSSPVPLHRLKALVVDGLSAVIFRLLKELDFPARIDILRVALGECTPPDLLQTLPEYVGWRAQARGGELKVSVLTSEFGANPLEVSLGYPDDPDYANGAESFLKIVVSSVQGPRTLQGLQHAGTRIIAHIPQDSIVDLRTSLPVLHSKELSDMVPNLRSLRLTEANHSTLPAGEDALPILEYLSIGSLRGDDPSPPEGSSSLKDWDSSEDLGSPGDWTSHDGAGSPEDWSRFVSFLRGRAATGKGIPILTLGAIPSWGEKVNKEVLAAVGCLERSSSMYFR